MTRFLSILLALLLTAAAAAGAEELVGVPVYPGAELDEATTTHMEEVLYVDGAAYRTNDGVKSVAEFYAAKGFKESGAPASDRRVLRKDKVEVAVQGPPRNDVSSGKRMNDTLISITRLE